MTDIHATHMPTGPVRVDDDLHDALAAGSFDAPPVLDVAPVEAAPVEAAPVEAAPVEAAPVEGTVGDTPVAEAASGNRAAGDWVWPEYPTPARRPANSVLHSERGSPSLPAWRDGLDAYLGVRA